MYLMQCGKCAICHKPGTNYVDDASSNNSVSLVVDHCHATGKVRGLLCVCCNIAIGLLRDDLNVFANASTYIRVASACTMSSAFCDQYRPQAVQTLGVAVSDKVVSLADLGIKDSDLEGVCAARIGVRTNGVMITWDGTDPTADFGIFLPADSYHEIVGNASIRKLKLIREAADNANVTLVLER